MIHPDTCINLKLLIHPDPCINIEILIHPDREYLFKLVEYREINSNLFKYVCMSVCRH
jgi:hypothetical protein